MKQVKPKKQLGQHFLTRVDIADRIAASIEPYKELPVIEVGPGMGILTQCLIERGFNLYVVEIDTESVTYLKANLPKSFVEEGRIIEGDILRIDLENIIPNKPKQPFVLIGNYPYNISGRLFFHIYEHAEIIPYVGGMLQKEVAQRITAPPGGRDYGILSVLLRSKYNGDYLFTVDKTLFHPAPKVDGGVLLLTNNNRSKLPCNEQLFVRTVKAGFQQRRKTLKNALKRMFEEQNIPIENNDEKLQHLLTLRAEKLDVDDYVYITQFFERNSSEP